MASFAMVRYQGGLTRVQIVRVVGVELHTGPARQSPARPEPPHRYLHTCDPAAKLIRDRIVRAPGATNPTQPPHSPNEHRPRSAAKLSGDRFSSWQGATSPSCLRTTSGEPQPSHHEPPHRRTEHTEPRLTAKLIRGRIVRAQGDGPNSTAPLTKRTPTAISSEAERGSVFVLARRDEPELSSDNERRGATQPGRKTAPLSRRGR